MQVWGAVTISMTFKCFLAVNPEKQINCLQVLKDQKTGKTKQGSMKFVIF